MKTSFRKLRSTLHHRKHDHNGRKVLPLAQLDELAKTSEELKDMRECYDSLLSAAAGATNGAFEFSESLKELGACLLQKIALNDDEETGKVLLTLGKLQFDLQRLVDSYRFHIFETITVPSESLLNELSTVEEMKRQCDEKRELYEHMRVRQKEKGRLWSGKGESYSTQQLLVARDEFDEEAALFVFRLKSLKQGQSRSLLTQAARHHAAQLSLFRKALKSLEAVEPHVKSVTEQHHIDYHFSGLDDDEPEDAATNSTEGEVDITFPSLLRVDVAKENLYNFYEDHFIREPKMLSQSAPIFPWRKVDPAERIRQLRPSSTRKFHSYVLPKPGDAKNSVSMESENPVSPNKASLYSPNLSHSLPLEPKKHEKPVGTENLTGPIELNSPSVLKENNNRMPPPLHERISSRQSNLRAAASNTKNIKRLSFSGPLTSQPMSTKPSFRTREPPQFSSGPILRGSMPQSSSPKISPSTPPTFMSSLRINELHELPRPPAQLNYNSARPSGFVGYSAPLVSQGRDNSISKLSVSKLASPLPTPPQDSPTLSPIPSIGLRARRVSPSSQLSEASSPEMVEGIASTFLTPNSPSNVHIT
ncbi:hypothetical protein Nepgr_016940 [Nepenthes gracilis]|uniref:BAR domain-containing protein n=1 Tax=Nepenthes gracilis TaxID=150966 RepID=A0AAD3SQL4_NEPGR|nr:hypothetical protein Nepgr_016940 [Nepenthes gracilis]